MTRTVLVPSSLAREAPDQRAATRKLGTVARAAAVFRVDRLVVFPDPPGEREWGGDFVAAVLGYATTPPYLRKAVWGRRDELQFAGILPPLRVPPRAGSGSNGSGSLRQGIVTEVGSDGRVRVNCGLQHPVSLLQPDGMSVAEGERVAVRVSSRRPVRARLTDEPLPGPTVERADLAATIDRADAGLRVATSRHGDPLTVGSLGGLVGRVHRDGCTVAFGAPGRGLPAMLGVEPAAAVDPDGSGFDRWLNTIPDQGSETVRTEEAMFATLAALTLKE
jgi:predicted SPOUT superfamily RNA methylase MTH1